MAKVKVITIDSMTTNQHHRPTVNSKNLESGQRAIESNENDQEPLDRQPTAWIIIKTVFIFHFILGLVALIINILLLNRSLEAVGLRRDHHPWYQVGVWDAVVVGTFVFSDFYAHLGVMICCSNLMWKKMSPYLSFWVGIRLAVFAASTAMWLTLVSLSLTKSGMVFVTDIAFGALPIFFGSYFWLSVSFRAGFIRHQENQRRDAPLRTRFYPPTVHHSMSTSRDRKRSKRKAKTCKESIV